MNVVQKLTRLGGAWKEMTAKVAEKSCFVEILPDSAVS